MDTDAEEDDDADSDSKEDVDAEKDADGGEWLALPKGVCEKLAGGSLTPKADDMKKDMMKNFFI